MKHIIPYLFTGKGGKNRDSETGAEKGEARQSTMILFFEGSGEEEKKDLGKEKEEKMKDRL